MGLRLSPEKTLITHIDEGLDFLGWRIQRHRKRGSARRYACTYPSRKAVKAVTGKVKIICRTTDTNLPLDALLLRLNLWVPRMSSTSSDQAVFVDHATDASVPSDTALLKVSRSG